MKQLREGVRQDDDSIKAEIGPKSSHGYGGQFGVEEGRMDKSAVGHEYHAKVDKHASQKGIAFVT